MEPTGPNVPTIDRPFASSSLLNFVLSGPFSNFVMATPMMFFVILNSVWIYYPMSTGRTIICDRG